MPRQRIDTIAAQMLTAGLFVEDPMLRLRAAGAVSETHCYFGQREATRLKLAFSGGDETSMLERIYEALLDGSWIEIDQNARIAEGNSYDDEDDDKHVVASLRYVTADNPYGWKRPERILRQSAADHDVPEEWNSYRQCHNISERDRVAAGRGDCKVRGCTRFEVLGKARPPKVNFDPAEVAVAKGMRARGETADASSVPVYGETRP